MRIDCSMSLPIQELGIQIKLADSTFKTTLYTAWRGVLPERLWLLRVYMGLKRDGGESV